MIPTLVWQYVDQDSTRERDEIAVQLSFPRVSTAPTLEPADEPSPGAGEAPGARLQGTGGADALMGGVGADEAWPEGGADQVRLEAGDDLVELEPDGAVDEIWCGDGNDSVLFHQEQDPLDVLHECEQVGTLIVQP